MTRNAHGRSKRPTRRTAGGCPQPPGGVSSINTPRARGSLADDARTRDHSKPLHSAPPPKFLALFADPRHYRADLRLLRMAIRRGWLADAPQADRDALVARFHHASAERQANDPHGRNTRATLAECSALLTLARADLDAITRTRRRA